MIPNPWVLLGVVLAWIASLVAVGTWQRHDGAAETVARYEKRDNASLIQANATIDRLNREARAVEQAHAKALADIGAKHAKDREQREAQHRRDLADARDGALKLYVPGACPAADDGGPAPTDTAASGGHDPTAGQLPGSVVADLLDFADDADRNTQQLGACQAVVLSLYPSTTKGESP